MRLLSAAILVCFVSVGLAYAGPREKRGAAAGEFDLYLLALSWSPGFCASGGDRKSREQCADGAGLGFVVHGLWPQYTHGYPAFCSPEGRSPRRSDLDIVKGVIPTEGLARYQWRKHGVCSGLAPSVYFAAIETVYRRLALPALPPKASPIDIERAFAAANPGLRTDMSSIDCGRAETGEVVLQEIRLCLSRDLRSFVTCPDEVERATCRASSIIIPEPR